MRNYRAFQGYSFDLDNPKSFTEKITWYITEYDGTEISKITDKILFKDYIRKKLGEGHTIPLYGHWDNIKDFVQDYENLPQQFVLKSNIQGSGNCIHIVKDKNTLNLDDVKDEVAKWLNPRNTLLDNYVCRMYNSKPEILAEAYMESFGSQLYDYKIFCFNGVPHCVYVAKDHFCEGGSLISFYDLEWNKLDVKYGHHLTSCAEKPKHFEQMLEYSRILSEGFPFVRVDFFDTDERLYLAELTFCPGGGLTPFHPQSFNDMLGELFVIPQTQS